MNRTVLVTGASSQLGVFLLPRLFASGYSIHAISRSVSGSPVKRADRLYWHAPGPPVEESVQSLISCGPLSLAVELAAQCKGLDRLVAFSTTSVLTKANSGNPDEIHQVAAIASDEKVLRRVCEDRGIRLLMLRPTLIYGCGLDQNISLLVRFGKRFGFIPVAGEATGLRQPVHADDLARLAVRALVADRAFCGEGPACGGTTLTYRQMVGALTDHLEGVRRLSIPVGLFAAAARLASILPAFRGVNAEMVRRQADDLVFDDSWLRHALDYDPRPFAPGVSDFNVPESAQLLQLG